MRDQYVRYGPETAVGDNVLGTVAANSKPFRTQRAPVASLQPNAFNITAPGGPYTVVYNVAPITGQVEVVTDTGEIIFFAAPGAGALTWSYLASRWSDQQILDALHEGMDALYPDFYQSTTDTSLAVSANLLEYQLPAVFLDPRVVPTRLDLQPPGFGSFKLWLEREDWERVPPQTLQLHQFYPAGSIMRVYYNAPYLALSDVDPIGMHLPVYYAQHKLMMEQETSRARQDNLPAQTGGDASQPGAAANVSQLWMQAFEREKSRLARPGPPIRMSVGRAP